MKLGPSAHVDTFARDHLPPAEEWPEFRLEGFDYPERLNAAVELTDRMVERGFGDSTALIGHGRRRTYKSSPIGAIGSLTRWSRITASSRATAC